MEMTPVTRLYAGYIDFRFPVTVEVDTSNPPEEDALDESFNDAANKLATELADKFEATNRSIVDEVYYDVEEVSDDDDDDDDEEEDD